MEQQLDSSVWQASKQKSDLFSCFGAARLLYTACAWLGIPIAEDKIFYRCDGVWVRVGEGCRGEEGGATGGGEGRPVAAAPRDGEVEGEAAAAKAEGREASHPRTCSRPSGARERGVRVRVRVGEQ